MQSSRIYLQRQMRDELLFISCGFGTGKTSNSAGLGARLYRAGCTGVQGWVHGLVVPEG